MTQLRKNIAFLFLLQIANYLIPLATIPYLSRVLGVRDFGVTGIAAGVISVMGMITDWGFSLTATQNVAHNAQNPEALHEIFWDVLWARIGLGLVAFLGLGFAMIFIPSVAGLGTVMLAASVQVIGTMLSVNWFLQGVEKMGAFVGTLLLGRALAIPLTFLFVHKPEDVAIATLIPGLASLFSCVVSFRIASRHVALFPLRFSVSGAWRQLTGGTKIFISTGAINLYTQSNILILSALTGQAEIGLYYGAERIRRAVQSLIGPIGTALFPRINNLIINDRDAAKHLMLRMLIGQGGFTFVLSLCMFVLAPWGVPFALGHDYQAAVPVVQWLAPLPFIIGLSNVLGINIMLPLGMKTEFAVIVSASAAVNFLAMLALCPSYGAKGAAISLLIAESFVTGGMAFLLWRRKKSGEIFNMPDAKG